LFVELVDDPLGPLQVQLLTLQRTVDVCQLDAHLAHQETVILIGPIDAGHALVAHLGTRGEIMKEPWFIESFTNISVLQQCFTNSF